MKKITLIGLLMLFITNIQVYSQTEFWSDNFEDTGSPSSGVRTPSNDFGLGNPSTMYFKRTTNNDVDLIFGSYSGQNGSSFWAGEDHDGVFGSGNAEQNITYSGIDISGKTEITFEGLFAANNISAAFENMTLGHSHSDYLIIEYSIDGGAYQSLLRFFSNNTTSSGTNNKTLAEDTNNDGVGDGALLTTNFTTFVKTISGTGTTLNLRVRCFTNAGNEEIAFDNFRLLEASCVIPTIVSNPANSYICVGGDTTFVVNANNATAYQWQEDSGSGFTDISNAGIYSGATTNTLSISGTNSNMSGYNYRCIIINGDSACYSISNSASLNLSNMITSGSKSDITCYGNADGAAAVSVSGGVTPYSYNWAPYGGTGSVATGLSAGVYTVTVTDNIGCTTSRNFFIMEPQELDASASSQINVSCYGESNGQATVSVTGGTTSYTFNWTGSPNGDGTDTVTGLPAGLITCYVTDANGCTDSVSFTITEPDMIDTTITQNSAQLTANQEGATYQWYQCPNTLLNGETNQSFEATEIGDYKVEITVGSCVETSACVTVSTLTVKPTEAISKFLMYPNPSSGSFHIQSALEGDFYVVNLLGQVVKTFDVEANIMKTITVNDLQNGIYFVKHRITNQSQKLIIKN